MSAFKPVDRWAGQGADFNRPVAEVIYKTLIGMEPDEAQVFSTMLLGATVQSDLMLHGQAIGKALKTVAAQRGELLKRQLSRSAIAKSRDGRDNGPELAALLQLSKALSLGGLLAGNGNDSSARAQRAGKQLRDLQTGEFKREHMTVDHTNTSPVPESLANRYGIPSAAFANIDHDKRAQFQNAYQQISAMVGPYQMLPKGSAFLHLFREGGSPNGTLVDIPHGDKAKLEIAPFDPDLGKITGAAVSTIPGLDAPGATFDVLRAFGLKPAAAAVGAGQLTQGLLNPSTVQRFGDQARAGHPNDQFIPSQVGFRRLRAGADLLRSALGPAAPPQATMALNVATHIGNFGPVAQKVIGPTVDRAAYRYRGTERKPDAALVNAFRAAGTEASKVSGGTSASNAVQDAAQHRDRQLGQNQVNFDDRFADAYRDWEKAKNAHSAGRIDRQQYKAAAKRNEDLIDAAKRRHVVADKETHEKFKVAAAEGAKAAERSGQAHAQVTNNIVMTGRDAADGEWNPGPVLSYFENRLPDTNLNSLQLKSGVVPPSEGVILDSRGRLAHQAVGYGDDHYLPFNLKNLRKLRGGEYIRTRTYGGPTTEDIYTGLISGARRLTVVSRSGVYTVAFDPSFKGGRRYNDKAARMVGRYGHLLDAVKNGNVTAADIDQSMKDQLRDQAAYKFPSNPAMAQVEYQGLLKEQYKNPTLSNQQKMEVATKWLSEASVGTDAKGEQLTPEQLTREEATRKAAKVVAEQRKTRETWQRYKRQREQLAADFPESEDRMPPTGPPPPMPVSLETATHAEMQLLDDMDPVKRATNIASGIGRLDSLNAAMKAAERANRDGLREMRLNGSGYNNALLALHEQFPYYILKPTFHPWANHAAEDTGYVKPRFNRPGEALAGYFDPTIGGDTGKGTGKATADSTRWQNFSVLQGATNPIPGRDGRAPTPAAPAATEEVPVAPPPEAAELQRDADRAMLMHLVTQENFKPGGVLTVGEKKLPLHGSIRASMADAPQGAVPELEPFFTNGVTAEQLLLSFNTNPAAMRVPLEALVNWGLKTKGFDIPADKLAAFQGRGVTDATAAPVGDIDTMLSAPNAEYKLGHLGDAYMPNVTTTTKQVQTAYGEDGLIQQLVKEGDLPENVNDPGYRESADVLAPMIKAEYANWADWYRRTDNGRNGEPATMPRQLIANYTEALVHANQLHRRYGEAADREREAAVIRPTPMGGGESAPEVHNSMSVGMGDWGPQQHLEFAQMSPDEQSAVFASMQQVTTELGRQMREGHMQEAHDREQAETRRRLSP